jgi:uncharacterized protein (DUF58 family)
LPLSLTPSGKRLALAAGVLALLGLVFADYVLLALAGTFIVLVIISALSGAGLLRSKIGVFTKDPVLRAVAGEPFTLRMEVAPEGWTLSLPSAPEMGYAVATSGSASFEGTFDLAAIRRTDRVKAHRMAALRLFKVERDVSLGLEFVVFPRLIGPTFRLLELRRSAELGGAEAAVVTAGEGAEYGGFKAGRGTEYASSRQYVPGDSLRFIDWKATARRNDFMIKEFLQPAGSSLTLVLDSTSTDPVSADLIATQFLGILYDALAALKPVHPTVYDGSAFQPLPGRDTIDEAIRTSLDMLAKYDPEPSRLLDVEFGLSRRPGSSEQPAGKDDSTQRRGAQVVVSQMVSGVAGMVESKDAVFVQPTQPWLHLRDASAAFLCLRRVRESQALVRQRGQTFVGLSA